MNCEHVEDLLSSFYDGELSDDLASDVARHLEHCPACQAELASFQRLGSLVSGSLLSSAVTPQPSAGNWPSIAARLQQETTESTGAAEPMAADPQVGSSAPTKVSAAPIGVVRSMAAAILALAAALFLLVGLRSPLGSSSHHETATVAAAVDYQDVLRLFQQQPQLAMETLSNRYEGREVSADQAEAMLGYRPSIAGGLPSQTRLVSTRLLKLPQCQCAGGKCTCGPGECNCAACLCERADGSKYMILEQCRTQEITFGDLPFTIAKRNSRDVKIVKSHDRLAVSWVKGDRRLTAIGLKDEAEAESLMSVLDVTPASGTRRG